MRKFYSCSVGEVDKDYDEDNLNRIISQKAFILHESTPQKGYYTSIKKGDILLLKYRGQFVGYGEALDIKKSLDKEWNLFAQVVEWHFKNSLNPNIGTTIYGMKDATLGGNQYGTVKPLEADFSLQKVQEIDSKTDLFKTIKVEFQKEKEQKDMQDKIDLLEYKKQIILQGPPGTGKTRLAKMMAEEMTKVNKLERPIDVISNHFKTYKPDESSIALREKINGLVKNFQEKFKKEDLKNLPLENYALGTDDKDGFCYWQEYILTDTGKYNGQADKGKIYWKNDEQRYVKSGFLQDIVNDDEAMIKMAELLDNIVSEKHNVGIDYPIGKGFILKMLNSYYPEKYFPISNEKCLTNALKLVGENTAGLNYIQKNTRLQEIFEEKREKYKTDITNNEFMYFLFVNFNLKKEVKLENDELLVEGEYKIIQFHPAYSYEDFVRGISAKTNDKGDVNYKVENRILIEFANESLDNPKAKYVLIIDEINRANLPSVLGELIYALEYRYSHKKNNLKEAAVESLYDISEDDGESNRVLLLPDNLYIIGTMNTADRSVGHIDYAIKRRFAFVNVPPTADAIDDVVKDPILNANAKILYQKVADLFNEDKSKNVYLQSDFKAKDVQLGHSYFLVENEKQLKLKLEFEIKPLLNEYVKDGILGESALAEIDAL
jgi:5-methylcytosine-specific restriction protein B